MTMLLRSVLVGCFRAGITKAVPSKQELRALAHELFAAADVNSDDKVSGAEFEPWANGHLESQRLLRKFGFKRAAVRLGTAAAQHARCGAQPAPSRRCALLCVCLRCSQVVGALPRVRGPQVSDENREALRQRLPTGRRSSLAARMSHTIIEKARRQAKEGTQVPKVLLEDRRFLKVKRLDNKARAMKLVTIATRKTLADMASRTRFTLHELQTLLEHFVDASDVRARACC